MSFAVSTHEIYGSLLTQHLPALLKSEIAARIEQEFGAITWAWVYDMPYSAALACMVVAFGLFDELREAAAQQNPTAAALELVREELQKSDVDVPEGIGMDALRVALTMAWNFNDQAIRCYSVSLNELIQKGEAGDDQALLNAVSIDPCAAGSAVFLRRLGHAKVLGHHGFLKKYRAALKGPHIARRTYRQLRWTDFLLRDIDANSTATTDQIFDLVAGTLKQYSSDGRDPVKGLQSRRDGWKKEATS